MDVSAYEKENVELLGRKRIYTDVDRITAKNVISVLQDALSIHKQNVESMTYLLRYEKGVQPLRRKKEIRKDINIEVVDNIANQVTEFKLGYNWGILLHMSSVATEIYLAINRIKMTMQFQS